MTIDLTPDQKIKVNGSESIYKIMREILLRENAIDQDKEHFWVVGLSYSLQILYIELIALGTQKSVQVEPMEVYSWALQKRCAKIVLVHNHPSSSLSPSQADKDITDRLIQVGKIVELNVIDHLIISTEDYYSFVDEGVLEELEGSTKYVPPFVLMEQYQNEAIKLRSEMSEMKSNLSKAMAISLLESGVELDAISRATGISLSDLKNLKR